jgi:hypothetical protein
VVDLIGDAVVPYALIMRTRRRIGTIYPDVTMEEVHHDDLVITDHPVEKGSSISDHSFKRPEEVDMRVGFSNSTAQTEGYVQNVYEDILALQDSREPFEVDTGKRHYTDMLIAGITATTDAKSEFALYLVVRLKKVKLTSTSGTAEQATDDTPNARTSNTGTQQLQGLSTGQGSVLLGTVFPATGGSDFSSLSAPQSIGTRPIGTGIGGNP